ncbi:MAG: N-acetylneuraminate synthase family protein [Desulfobacteraceae bacterium]|nr:N-acetylneuraminate synthase family protein [Desulfobacteraceae bacterium]
MITIQGKKVGDGNPVFIVFEAGPTHDGIESAKQLVKYAAKAGADAIKFQILDPERLVPDKTQVFSYEILVNRESGEQKQVTEPLYDILMRRYLTFEQWGEVKRFCDDLGIIFFSTAAFTEEVDFLKDIGVDTLKICSGDVNHFPFIKYCAETGMSIQLDTGNATIGEVEKAYDEVLKTGNDRIIVHNCPSGYPARLESINLNIIPSLKQLFGCPVAFSDHTPGWEMDIAAVALGANMVEKTITLDRTSPSVEHIFSLEFENMKKFVKSIRNLETALGNSRRIMSKDEREIGQGARRSIVLSKDVKKGDLIESHTLDYARPGTKIAPYMTDILLKRKFTRDIIKGSYLSWGDFK